MKIQSLTIQNYRSYGPEEQEINLENGLNYIVGANGSGKTNIIRAIKLISSSVNAGTIPLGNLNPDIQLKLKLILSDDEVELLGIFMCKTILTQLDTYYQDDNLSELTREIFQPIFENLDQSDLNDIFMKLTNQLHLDTGFEATISQITPQIHKSKIDLVRTLLFEKGSTDLALGIGAEKYFTKLNNILLQNETHSIVGEIFRNLEFEIMGDLTTIYSSMYFIYNNDKVNLNYSSFIINNDLGTSSNRNLVFCIHDYIQSSKTVSNTIVNDTLTELLKSSDKKDINSNNIKLLEGKGILRKISNDLIGKINQLEFIIQSDESHNLSELMKLIYKQTTILIPEHRGLISENSSDLQYLTLPVLAEKLYQWKNNTNHSTRQKYYNLQIAFEDSFGMQFDVHVEDQSLILNEGPPQLTMEQLEIEKPSRGWNQATSDIEDVNIIRWKENQIMVLERKPKLQFVSSNNIPITLEDSPSGSYEILLILTALSETGSKTVIIDEPARALHPQLQKKISRTMSNNNHKNKPMFLIITHSPFIIQSFKPNKIWKCLVSGQIMNLSYSKLKKVEAYNIEKFFQNVENISSLFFTERVIFVEGINDALFLKELDKSTGWFQFEENNIDIVILKSKTAFPIAFEVANLLNFKFVILLDRDAAFEIANKGRENEEKLMFKDSVIGKMIPNFIEPQKLTPYLTMLYDDVKSNDKLTEFYKTMNENGVYIWDEGRLEDIILKSWAPSENCPVDLEIMIEGRKFDKLIYQFAEDVENIDNSIIIEFCNYLTNHLNLK